MHKQHVRRGFCIGPVIGEPPSLLARTKVLVGTGASRKRESSEAATVKDTAILLAKRTGRGKRSGQEATNGHSYILKFPPLLKRSTNTVKNGRIGGP